MAAVNKTIPPDITVSDRVQVRRGELVLYEGRSARIVAVESPSKIMLLIVGTRKVVWASAAQLEKHIDGTTFDRSRRGTCNVPTNQDLREAKQWVNEFEHLDGNGWLRCEEQIAIAAKLGVSVRTVARHFKAYLDDPTPVAQLRQRPGPQKGSTILSPVIEALMAKCIEEKYESELRFSVQATADEIVSRFRQLGLHGRPPSYSTVLARIRDRPRWRAERKRHGRVRGDAKAGPAGPATRPHEALEFVQIDHAIVDLIVVDPRTRQEIGRPWITLAIDVGTRTILGFHLSFYAPSQESVALTLEHCCCPKDEWLSDIGYEGEWRPFGLIKKVGWDNAKCFKPTPLQRGCELHGIEVLARRVRTPTHGAYIERYIGTYMGKIHLLKGTTFSNTKDREDYNSQEKAVMSLEELTLWTAHEINGVYHNKHHRGLGCTPLEAWSRAWLDKEGRCEVPPFPSDRRAFRLAMMPGKYRLIGREGIHLFGLKYWDDFLIPLIGNGRHYWVAYDGRMRTTERQCQRTDRKLHSLSRVARYGSFRGLNAAVR